MISLAEPTPAARERWPDLADVTIATAGQLAVFLGGSADSFTGLLVVLMDKADQRNRDRIAAGFPREVLIYSVWQLLARTPTYAELQTLSDIITS